MSSAQGFPDWQRITQWLGPPLVTETGRVIGAGTITDGPYQVSNFASVIVALKATGGNVTVTIKQTVPAGPASLVLTESVVVAAGATLFEAFVLYGGAVELDLTGSVAGTSVDYALYGSNTTTNAQVITAATINVQHNDVLVAAEQTLDLVDGNGYTWAPVDDSANTRVKVPPPLITRGIALPGSPVDLQQFLLNLGGTWPGVEWLCVYNAGTTYWDVIGQAIKNATVDAGAFGSNLYVDAGQQIVIPAAITLGDFDIEFGGRFTDTVANDFMFLSPKYGAAAAADADGIEFASTIASASNIGSLARSTRVTGLTGGEVVKLQGRVSAGGGGTINRIELGLRPIRIK